VRVFYGIRKNCYGITKNSIFFIINTLNTYKRGTAIELRFFEIKESFLAYSIKETFSKEALEQSK